MLEWIPYLLLGMILMFPLLQAGFWLNTRRLKGTRAPEFEDLLDPAPPHDGRILFYFYSTHCGPCKTMTPRLERMALDFPNIVMVNINDQDELTCRFGISAVPSIVVINQGRIQCALLGKQSERKLRALVTD